MRNTIEVIDQLINIRWYNSTVIAFSMELHLISSTARKTPEVYLTKKSISINYRKKITKKKTPFNFDKFPMVTEVVEQVFNRDASPSIILEVDIN